MAGGRDQLGPLERLTRLLLALEQAEPHGRGTDELVRVAEYGSTRDPARQLNRDVNALRKIGWDIRNVAGAGEDAVYRLYARDTRLRVELAPEHQVELVRAALAAGNTKFRDRIGDDLAGVSGRPDPDLVHTRDPQPHGPGHDALDKAAHAVESRCLIHFTYKQRPRTVHPYLVHPGASGWYLVGCEDGATVTKRFVTDRMSDVELDRPGTAVVPDELTYDELNPITWDRDPRVDVVVETIAEHRPQVEAMLGTPTRHEVDGDSVRLTIPVTHRAAFRARVYELGRRVRVVAPDEMRQEILAELRMVVHGPGR